VGDPNQKYKVGCQGSKSELGDEHDQRREMKIIDSGGGARANGTQKKTHRRKMGAVMNPPVEHADICD